MKCILLFVFLLCLNFAARSQWPINQNIGSDSTMVRVGPNKSGGLWGGIVVKSFSDTTAANLTRIRQYEGGMIFTTGDSSFWYRSPGAVKWFKFSSNTVNSSGWNIGGNLFPVLPTPQPNIGTLAPWGGAMGFMTNSVTHLVLPDAGITNNDNDSLRVLVYEPNTTNIRYRSATSFRPYTFTNGLTESGGTVKLGGTLVDATTTINGDGNNMTLSNIEQFSVSANDEATISALAGGVQTIVKAGNGSSYIFASRTGASSVFYVYPDTLILNPDEGNLKIDSLNYTLTTTGKKIMLRDTASGLVQNIDPLLIAQEATNFADTTNFKPVVINTTGTAGTTNKLYKATYWPGGGGGATPAGNYGNIQINRNGALAAPASDSLDFESATGLSVKGNITSSTLTSGRIVLPGTAGILQDDDNFTFNTTDNELLLATTTDNGAYKFQVGGDALFNGGSLKLTTGSNTRIDYNTNAIYVFANSGTYIGTGSSTYAITAKSGNVHIGTGNDPTMRLQVYQGRFGESQGTDVASAAGAIALSSDGNTFEITGTAAITLISNANWQNGSVIHLIFTSTATLTDGTANSGTDIGMELAGNANFTASADDVVTLVLSELGSVQRWREVSRSVN